ncbi:MAG: histidine triad nucleotide-binding protein [Patescibacteria group bacterium]|nr:histidine triad nucleotide-binding protein [Patescibacteria group bacterium]
MVITNKNTKMNQEANCIFCKITNKEISAEIVFENDNIIAFNDIHPIAPVHVILIPKKHIATIADINEEDKDLMGELIWTAKKIAEDLKIADKGYKLLFRVKEYGGQEISHIHLHLIGGAQLHEDIRPV